MEAIKKPCYDTKDEDHISRLPDFLIHHILSFVNITYAVQTCMLSKRWRNIWTSLPFLTFDRSVLGEGRYQSFLDFVEYVLSFRDNRCFDIRRFHLLGRRGKYDCNFIKCLHRWIIVVARSNVEDIYVQFNGDKHNDEFRVPDSVFTCKSLTNLELDLSTSCKIIPPNSISLPRLKYLKLKSTAFNHDELTKLCSSCPVLEHLDLISVRSTTPLNITISSPALKHFDISGISTTAPLNISISSLTLEHLVISGIITAAPVNITISSVTLEHFKLHIEKSIRNTLRLYAPNLVDLVLSNLDSMLLEDVSSLVTADVGVQVKPRKLLNDEFPTVHAAADTLESLKSLHNVRKLTISFQPLKAS
ncbi:putative FBD-associated F-box protein At5g22720 [Papaver somniferum]|uniref:putative FBD-associated F-box protein At5g22720 n=1 Tax=Papaver somniferum TaxID=3469 RepID=UPI000E704F0E|nr:putative FBD-associated F-box protein At5g22720 [Papaver somniferum]